MNIKEYDQNIQIEISRERGSSDPCANCLLHTYYGPEDNHYCSGFGEGSVAQICSGWVGKSWLDTLVFGIVNRMNCKGDAKITSLGYLKRDTRIQLEPKDAGYALVELANHRLSGRDDKATKLVD
ncbi:hypothetical protein ACFL2C_04185 [Patescibacteria group bacterium]